MSRLDKQIEFILEIDRLKGIIRRSHLVGVDRLENSAEHSWHVALLSVLLAEYSDLNINPLNVLKMLLFHDIVEIDAGDTYFFDSQGNADKAEREAKAATRLFGMLPGDQAEEFRSIWEEYEACETDDAKFAYALDRFIPVLHSFHTQGKSWKQHDVHLGQVMQLIEPIKRGSVKLAEYAEGLFRKAVALGYLKDDKNGEN